MKSDALGDGYENGYRYGGITGIGAGLVNRLFGKGLQRGGEFARR